MAGPYVVMLHFFVHCLDTFSLLVMYKLDEEILQYHEPLRMKLRLPSMIYLKRK